jgi:hypothetical protein
MTEITQRIYSGSSKGTMTGFIGATPLSHVCQTSDMV